MARARVRLVALGLLCFGCTSAANTRGTGPADAAVDRGAFDARGDVAVDSKTEITPEANPGGETGGEAGCSVCPDGVAGDVCGTFGNGCGATLTCGCHAGLTCVAQRCVLEVDASLDAPGDALADSSADVASDATPFDAGPVPQAECDSVCGSQTCWSRTCSWSPDGGVLCHWSPEAAGTVCNTNGTCGTNVYGTEQCCTGCWLNGITCIEDGSYCGANGSACQDCNAIGQECFLDKCCQPKTCAQLGANEREGSPCGVLDDGCNRSINCGTACPSPLICGTVGGPYEECIP